MSANDDALSVTVSRSQNIADVQSADVAQTAREIGAAAAAVAPEIGQASTSQKNSFLQAFIDNLKSSKDRIMSANAQDMAAAGNLADSLKDRLLLDEKRMASMSEGLATVAGLPDPVGEMSELRTLPSGIQVGKMRMPLGVILAIYESRPNVTADIAALALKSGNAVILRGGSEARHSNVAIGECLTSALAKVGLPEQCAQVTSNTDRALVGELLACDSIDLAIPRGGRGLIERVAETARMPVLKHLDGNCHVYVDAAANLETARKIVINAKTRRYGVCNAAESLLVHQQVAREFLTKIEADFNRHNVQMRGCAQTREVVDCQAASEDDFAAEYLAPIISVKVVADVGAAIAHINKFGSAHTDAIVTDNAEVGQRFLREVDSSSVMLNASTSFADGGEYGLGAEVGISTSKFHARGPVGLDGLTCQKYVVIGSGNVRA